jgi:2,3-bisphosphoglycerate-dependent phosphoglycerate mutase
MRLTGWADVPLSRRGRVQARQAGLDLRARGIVAEVCYSSRLVRAIETRDLLLDALGAAPPRYESWRINERHYGALQGLRWWQAVWRFGLAAVRRCKSEFDARPPLLAETDDSAPAGIAPSEVSDWRAAQRGESLADALRRFLPLWTAEIAPALRSGACVFIVAHNNVLRALIRHLEGGCGLPVPHLATAQPWIIELDAELHVVRRATI